MAALPILYAILGAIALLATMQVTVLSPSQCRGGRWAFRWGYSHDNCLNLFVKALVS